MKPSKCCNQNCNQGRNCEVRMPERMGMSQPERDMLDQVRQERNAVVLAALCFILALMLFDLLERVPT
ncbi:MAG: hypothetical protein V4641_31455 [Pseudomonadota bacterium]